MLGNSSLVVGMIELPKAQAEEFEASRATARAGAAVLASPDDTADREPGVDLRRVADARLPLKITVDSIFGSRPLPGFLNAILPQFAQSRRRWSSLPPHSSSSSACSTRFHYMGAPLARHLHRGAATARLSLEAVSPRAAALAVLHDSNGTADAIYRNPEWTPRRFSGSQTYGFTPRHSAPRSPWAA